MLVLKKVLACVLLSWISMAVEATVLPDSSVTGTVLFNLDGRRDSAEFGSIALDDARSGSVGFTASGTPFPSLVANAYIGPNNLIPSIFGRGAGVLTYYFEIVGPSGTVPVLIDVGGVATGLATPGASFAVESQWALFDSISLTTVLAGDDIRSGQLTGSFGQSFNRTVSLTLSANRVYPVFMKADAGAAATDVGSNAIADAFVDPIFSFGPGVDPLAYSFNFSNGIGNSHAAAVPEPVTFALLSVGLLSLAVLRRRRTESIARGDDGRRSNCPMKKRGAFELASQTLIIAGQVFRYAVATGMAKQDHQRRFLQYV